MLQLQEGSEFNPDRVVWEITVHTLLKNVNFFSYVYEMVGGIVGGMSVSVCS